MGKKEELSEEVVVCKLNAEVNFQRFMVS